MIKANTIADTIEIQINGNAEQLIRETGALLGRSIGTLLPVIAMSNNCSMNEAEGRIRGEINQQASITLRKVRRELEGDEPEPQETPQAPRRRRRLVS